MILSISFSQFEISTESCATLAPSETDLAALLKPVCIDFMKPAMTVESK